MIVEDTPERVAIKCWVRTARTPYFFEKTLALNAGSPVLEVEQTLTNEGEEVGHCVWGEHIALGPPFLSPDCVIDLPGGTLINHDEQHHPNATLKLGARTPWPMTEDQQGNPVDASRIAPKEARRYDMSYIADMPGGLVRHHQPRDGGGIRRSMARRGLQVLVVLAVVRWRVRLPVVGANVQHRSGTFLKLDESGYRRRDVQRHGNDPSAGREGVVFRQSRCLHGFGESAADHRGRRGCEVASPVLFGAEDRLPILSAGRRFSLIGLYGFPPARE